jgi:DNA-directed RNA polymerase specialized sigma24 family protein
MVAGGVFAALDADWERWCRHCRRADGMAEWGREPALSGLAALAEVVPPPGEDRAVLCRAVGRLAAEGDALAARALLQLLVPGLAAMAGRWRWRLGGPEAAGWEVVSRAAEYIARLARADIHCSPAGYVLRSVERDVAHAARRRARSDAELVGTPDDPPGQLALSAEHEAFAGPLARWALVDATSRGGLPLATAALVWLHVSEGHSLPECARRTGLPVATAYRLRARSQAVLYEALTA